MKQLPYFFVVILFALAGLYSDIASFRNLVPSLFTSNTVSSYTTSFQSSSTTTTTTTTTTTKHDNNLTQQRENLNRTTSSSNKIFELDDDSKYNNDYYSGMWWVNIQTFQKMNVNEVRSLEDATFNIKKVTPRIIMSKDWLDFSVEHLSKYFRHFNMKRDYQNTYNRYIEILYHYINQVVPLNDIESIKLVRKTIAIIPLSEMAAPGQTIEALLQQPQTTTNRKERDSVLQMYMLVATILSLYRIGIARIVVVGRTDVHETSILFNAAYTIVQNITSNGQTNQTLTELVYITTNHTQYMKNNKLNMPAITLQLLHKSLLSSRQQQQQYYDENIIKEIFGNDVMKRQYIYFTEPDLILHTRQSFLQYIESELHNGTPTMLAASRLNPLIHSIDFPNFTKFYGGITIPNYGNFSIFYDIHPLTHICCDAGNYWPGKDEYKSCGNRWNACGYTRKYRSNKDSIDAFQRLQKYPLIRIKSGLGVPVVNNHARICIPKTKNQNC